MLRLAPLVLALAASAATPADDAFVPLFDGRTTDGWVQVGGQPGNWSVDDGRLVTKGQGGGWLSTGRTYADFALSLEYSVSPGGNSGVFLRAPRQGDPAYSGMEIQVLDDDAEMYRDLKPSQYTGSIYGVVAAQRGHTRPPDHWNRMEITAVGPKVTVALNGTTIVDADLTDQAAAAAAHPGIKRTDGYIGLQSHSDRVEFRNIMIKELTSPGAPAR
jgi:hypothetical protein